MLEIKDIFTAGDSFGSQSASESCVCAIKLRARLLNLNDFRGMPSRNMSLCDKINFLVRVQDF